jgi:hypothetical protein
MSGESIGKHYAVSAWRLPKSVWLCVIAACLVASACTRAVLPVARALPGMGGAASRNVGEWHGQTSQRMPIAFTVSPNETVTTITVGFDFNGCTGSHTFSDLMVSTNPDVTCISGPCPSSLGSYRAFSYIDGTFGNGPVTQVNGLFLPGSQASGQINFRDYPECGTATAVEWTATRR